MPEWFLDPIVDPERPFVAALRLSAPLRAAAQTSRDGPASAGGRRSDTAASRPELRADMQRLFRARSNEKVMWTVRGWSGPAGWPEKGYRGRLLQWSDDRCVRILHVGKNGAVVGPAPAAFPKQSAAGLLDAWLRDEFVRTVPVKPGEPLHVGDAHPGDFSFWLKTRPGSMPPLCRSAPCRP